MQSLIRLQVDISQRISKQKINFRKCPKERQTKQYLEGRLDCVESLWKQFNDNHTQIIKESDPKLLNESSYVTDDLYCTTEELYIDLKCDFKTALLKVIKSSETLKVPCAENKGASVKLPKIIIPTFSGKYTEWPTFRDLFISVIDKNSSIDKVQKLHYLKGYLTGEAEQLLRQIPVSEANYDRCWALLESRYNNKKYLSHCIIKRLLSQRNILSESASALKELIDTTVDCLGALSNVGIDVKTWDILVIHLLSLKLDAESRKQWELNVTNNINIDELPTFEQFKDFIISRYRALEFLDSKIDNNNKSRNVKVNKVLHAVNHTCPYCNGGHRVNNCHKFSKEEVDTRRKFVHDHNLCFNCLGHGHSVKHCRITSSCRICRRRHHSLLHPKGDAGPSNNVNDRSNTEIPDETAVSCFSKGTANKQILLATALIKAVSKNRSTYIRALVDPGSQASFVTEGTVQSLGLKKKPVKGIISSVGGCNNLVANSVVEVKIQSRLDPTIELVVRAYVLKSITSLLPEKETITLSWVEGSSIELADPKYHLPDRVDMLLGADIYTKILKDGVIKGPSGSTAAQCTTLGWILSGIIDSNLRDNSNIRVMHVHTSENDYLKRFWEIESEGSFSENPILTNEEIKCEQIFQNTTTRDENGRYVVNLPFRDEEPTCMQGDSREIALKRFHLLENRLHRNPQLKSQYSEVINEYIQLGHMRKLSVDKQTPGVYLPHHAVIRNDKDTTKVRVVFDASCKGKNGRSLNDDLMIGPTLQPELRHLLMRWRIHPICLVSDVVKMYRQVRVADKHTNFQRIVWRNSKEEEIAEYELLTVTFGTASAPFLAVRSMQQLAVDEGREYPLAAERVKKDYYMDDLMTGCETVEEGIEIYNQMNALLGKGKFELQKWSSNSNELLQEIKKERKKEGTKAEIYIKQDEIMKTLGLTWRRCDDSFQYSVKFPELQGPVTKRKIISDISRLFDPLGWVAPVIVVAKMMIQKLWISGIGWDDEIPNDLLNEWGTYRRELLRLSEFTIPRWLGTKQSDKQIDLHGFCDASKMAYAAVLYTRVVDSEGNIHVTLLTAKTKVAPIKTVSIPRLELCGAVLLAKLLQEVAWVLQLHKSNIHAWTDSEIVLAWLNSHPSRWKTFIANRVSEVLCKTEPQQWKHVPSKQNPADYASRGLSPADLINSTMWVNGPDFLHKTEITLNQPVIKETKLEEIRVHNVTTSQDDFIWNKYSSLSKLVRVVAFCRRVLDWKKPKSERKSGYLTAEELNLAMETCIRESQSQHFSEEILMLKNKTVVAKKSKIHTLTPYLDSSNILRVGGRLGKSNVEVDQKHPIIMHHKSPITELIVAEAHQKTLHGGAQLMLNYLSTKYYIIGVKSLVKSYIRKCVTCIRYSVSKQHQLMGQLPSARVTPSKPFSNTGVDYAGPISLRTSKGRGHHAYKGYICLFVCMATKAVHIEVVSDLTTQGFLAAFRRFVSRRGHCSNIWSDNGTNFQGAAKELRVLFDAEKGQIAKEIAESLANNGTTWHYIPPHAPNFGGLWEAGIKSCKQHLKRVIGSSTLTYEEMATLLSQIEACLNSRPLYRLTDSNQIDALSPGHFLVGEPIINVPDHNFESSNISSLKRFQLVQRMMQTFWRRWSNEYLSTLLQRHKWSHQTVEPGVGDIVLVKEDDLPPARWLLGRVIEKHPGQDGLTRVVTLRTKASTIKRPTSKLCILPCA